MKFSIGGNWKVHRPNPFSGTIAVAEAAATELVKGSMMRYCAVFTSRMAERLTTRHYAGCSARLRWDWPRAWPYVVASMSFGLFLLSEPLPIVQEIHEAGILWIGNVSNSLP